MRRTHLNLAAMLNLAIAATLGADEPGQLSFHPAPGFEPLAPQLVDADGNSTSPPPSFFSGTPVGLADGQLLMVYAQGGDRFRDNTELRAANSADNGATWDGDRTIEHNPDPAVQHGRPTALVDRDGAIHVFYFGFVRYTKDPATSQSDMWTVRSRDGGQTWGDRQRIWSGYTGMTEPAIQTRSGRLLVPLGALVAADRFGACVVRSDDGGQSWSSTCGIDIPPEADAAARAHGLNGGALEPTLCELSDGRILMLVRSITGHFWQSISTDDGATWPPLNPTALGCGGTAILRRLADGTLLCIHNPPDPSQIAVRGYPHGFGSQAISVSHDDGATWSAPAEFVRAPRTVHSVALEYRPGALLFTLPELSAFLVHRLPDDSAK